MSPIGPLLVCGLVAPPLSLATDLLAIARAEGYRPVAQSISELSAVGAPTRPLVTGLEVVRDGLLLAFGRGVLEAAGGNRALATTGGLIAANAAISAVATVALPRDYARPTWAARNTANTLVMAAGVGCFVAAMGTGAAGVGGRFRAFSAGIPMAYALLTVFSLLLQRGRGTSPSTGAQERTMAWSYQGWIAILAVVLLRRLPR
jgi:hypothetical protein